MGREYSLAGMHLQLETDTIVVSLLQSVSGLDIMGCQLSDLGFIKIQGNDAKKFLQGQVTCDVAALSNGEACMGAHCNPQGRVISLFHLFQFQDAYYLLLPASMIAITISALKKYAVFSKSEIMDVSEDWLAFGLEVDETGIESAVSIPLAELQIAAIPKEFAQQLEINNTLTLDRWKFLRINAGIPVIYPETSGKFLPHEINLPALNAVNFDKGCYTGQEIIARMHYRGKLKTHLQRAEVVCDVTPLPGEDLYVQESEWKPSGGVIVDAVSVSENAYQLLIITNEKSDLFLTREKCQKIFELSLRN